MPDWNQMQKNAVASRLKYILSDDGTMTDILSIFFDVRSARSVPAEVADLGDFAAHRAERNRGPLLTRATALSKQVSMHLQGQSPLNAFPGYTAEHVSETLLLFFTGAFQVSEPIDHSLLIHLVALHGLA
jgi:hypothetical protein